MTTNNMLESVEPECVRLPLWDLDIRLAKPFFDTFMEPEEAEVSLEPITVFIGRNSTGKSGLALAKQLNIS